jgi:hypothetical protein
MKFVVVVFVGVILFDFLKKKKHKNFLKRLMLILDNIDALKKTHTNRINLFVSLSLSLYTILIYKYKNKTKIREHIQIFEI